MMWALDFTLNSVTMLALVLMVGIVIDDAIVVLENIFRFVEEKKMTPFEAARRRRPRSRWRSWPRRLSLVVIFVPVSFMSSISGRFLYQFGITAAVAILVSLLVSFTLTPMMSARLLRRRRSGGARPGVARGLLRGTSTLLHGLLGGRCGTAGRGASPWLVIAVVGAALRLVRQEYVPSDVDEAEFEVGVTAPRARAWRRWTRRCGGRRAELRAMPGVRHGAGSRRRRVPRAVNRASCLRAHRAARGAVFSIWRLICARSRLDPGRRSAATTRSAT
jgi:multidrug efflux pump subunit AcrB